VKKKSGSTLLTVLRHWVKS